VNNPITIAPEALDFTQLIRAGETVGWAEATAEPVFLTRILDAQAERCPPFRVFFALTFSEALAAGHANVTVAALGGASGYRGHAAGAVCRRTPRRLATDRNSPRPGGKLKRHRTRRSDERRRFE
jgi:hypothetical protein